MEDIVDTKGIERTNVEMKIETIEEEKPIPKPKPVSVVSQKKERSQAQKDAFEKARTKRAENLAKKKLEEEKFAETPAEVLKQNNIEAPKQPKKRGRPRKSKIVEDEPPAQQFIPPQQQFIGQPYKYASNTNQQFNPYHYPLPLPHNPAPVQPINNYYYYGAPPPSHPSNKPVEQKVQFEEPEKKLPVYEPEPSPYTTEEEDEEEYELPPDPRLKFSFAG